MTEVYGYVNFGVVSLSVVSVAFFALMAAFVVLGFELTRLSRIPAS
jgi:hypothetical protein